MCLERKFVVRIMEYGEYEKTLFAVSRKYLNSSARSLDDRPRSVCSDGYQRGHARRLRTLGRQTRSTRVPPCGLPARRSPTPRPTDRMCPALPCPDLPFCKPLAGHSVRVDCTSLRENSSPYDDCGFDGLLAEVYRSVRGFRTWCRVLRDSGRLAKWKVYLGSTPYPFHAHNWPSFTPITSLSVSI